MGGGHNNLEHPQAQLCCKTLVARRHRGPGPGHGRHLFQWQIEPGKDFFAVYSFLPNVQSCVVLIRVYSAILSPVRK